jgi:hypothetical protein
MKLFFSSITFGCLSFLLWSALKVSKPEARTLRQPWHQSKEGSSEGMDDPKLPPLRDPWDRKWKT